MFSRNLYEVLCPFHSAPLVHRVQLGQAVIPTCPRCKKRLLLDGRYALRGVLGEGGFGRVFWAEDVADNFKRVTVKQAAYQGKRLHETEMKAEVISQMISESQVLKRLAHRQIPELFGLFAEGLEVFLVEEYMQGESLSQLSERKRGINRAEAREVLEDIVPVLLYLHNGFVVPLVHNDISPKNIIAPAPERKQHALIDLGSARQIGNSLTEIRSFHPHYAAPEVVASYEISAESDQYSLGATVISALSGGDSPRTADRAYEFWQASLQEFARREHDDTLVAVLSKMTQRDPRDRYHNLREVLSGLSETPRRIAVPSESVFGGRSGYVRMHDIELAPFGRRCRDFQTSRDMSTVGFRAGAYELHLIDVAAAKSVISLNIGVPFRYKVSADGKWTVVQVQRCPSLRGLGLPEGGVFVVETSTGKLTVLLDKASLSPTICKEIEKASLDEDSPDDLLLFSPQSQRLFLGLHTGLIMSWCCTSWERSENYRKERGSSIKFNALIPGGEGIFLAGDGSNFVVFREGDGEPQGELSIPTRSRGQRVLPWDGKNTWVSQRAELFDGGKHLIAISSCDLEDSLPRATTHSLRELASSPVSDIAACGVVGLVATTSPGESFVRLYNADLKQVDILSTPSSPARVVFSPRGNYLFVCGGDSISVFRRG